jgi:hypothetical protein
MSICKVSWKGGYFYLEENLSAKEAPAQEGARVSQADENRERKKGAFYAAQQGQSAPFSLRSRVNGLKVILCHSYLLWLLFLSAATARMSSKGG